VDDSNAGVGSVGSPGDRTLTAQWSLLSYNINYDLNGGLFGGIPTTTFNVESNFSFLTPTRAGYNFEGWFDDDGNELTGIVPGMSGDLDITAYWMIRSYNLITIAYTGQTPSVPVSYEFGEEISITEPTRRGYDFDGWEESNGTNWASGDSMPGKNLTLTGQWNIVTYTISYDLNSGSGYGNPTTFTVLQSLTLNSNPTRTGWTFAGWDSNGDDTPEHTTAIAAGTYAEDITLKAIWTQNIYTLTYNSAGGSAVASKTFTYFQSLNNTYFPAPTRDGYYFTGWYDSSNNRWATGAPFFNIGPNGNLTLTARWTPILYSLYVEPGFDNGSGGGYSVGSYYTDQEMYIGFAPYRPGFTFTGWKDLETGTFYENGDPMPPRDLTLTAQWAA
jgi:uncharacterized repeat protein (TIGR02543 family)